jgi:hypothetical protein
MNVDQSYRALRRAKFCAIANTQIVDRDDLKGRIGGAEGWRRHERSADQECTPKGARNTRISAYASVVASFATSSPARWQRASDFLGPRRSLLARADRPPRKFAEARTGGEIAVHLLNRLGICRSAVRHCTKKWSDLRRKSSKLGLGSLLDRCEKTPQGTRAEFG